MKSLLAHKLWPATPVNSMSMVPGGRPSLPWASATRLESMVHTVRSEFLMRFWMRSP